ncbi:sulfotransferase [Rhodovulum sp.]|uniref:sulfotransferase n=1 Tax=Rhodovulum sp. TaxID=34009 RepID=UPI001809828A|nr:sulfotransferase [Rhodovulum sp.]HDR28491.1 hypothetical protein [Rhodovulum sp.]
MGLSRALFLSRCATLPALCAVGLGPARDTERGWQAVRDHLRPDQVFEIRYERLIRDTETVLRQVCAFCGLSFDPRILAYDANSTYSKPDTSLVEQWKRMQTPREIGLVEYRIGALLTETGYAPSGHPATPRAAWKGWRWRCRTGGRSGPPGSDATGWPIRWPCRSPTGWVFRASGGGRNGAWTTSWCGI